MLNNVILVGRIVEEPDVILSQIKIATQRAYKNERGMYDTDFFNIKLSSDMLEDSVNYLKKGDLVGVKGHLETDFTNEIYIKCDKLTHLYKGGLSNDNY